MTDHQPQSSIFDGIPTAAELDALPAHIRDAYRRLEADSGKLAVMQDAFDAACDEIDALKRDVSHLRRRLNERV